ncbi:hypothetical protein ABZ016_28005 [Streptomyces sp. NPDC006372]|uniref:hypothetical protein n=1 Tax=Streptomyces sp. NPDC006372 TaxID=3155599 RepID=UPI0033B3AD95
MNRERAAHAAAGTATGTDTDTAREHAAAEAAAAAGRQKRFGRLPERVRPEDMSAETDGGPRGAAPYNPEGSWKYFSCLALDPGL